MVSIRFRPISLQAIFSLAITLIVAQPAMSSGPYQEGYPPPVEATVEAPLNEAVPTSTSPIPYPPPGSGLDGVAPIPIGEETTQETLSNSEGVGGQIVQQGSSRGLLFLWLGFVGTLLIFLTSVIGAIVLFTRRNET